MPESVRVPVLLQVIAASAPDGSIAVQVTKADKMPNVLRKALVGALLNIANTIVADLDDETTARIVEPNSQERKAILG